MVQYADICLLEANSRSICRDLLLNNTHESRALFEPQVQLKIARTHWVWLGIMPGFLLSFWLVILTSSKVHLHFKCAKLTKTLVTRASVYSCSP